MVKDSAEEYGLISQHSGKSQIHFTVRNWDAYQAQHAGKGWGPRERILTFRFYNDVNQLHLRFMIGPGPQNVRQALFKEFQQHQKVFNLARGQVGQKEKTVYQRRDTLNASDYEDPDIEQMKEKIQERWLEFLGGDLVRIKEIVAELPWQALAQEAQG
jgi:hypothetical protein